MQDKCTIDTVEYGAKVWAYFEVDEDGRPLYNTIDDVNLMDAVREPYDEVYACKVCGDEFKVWGQVIEHLKEPQKGTV